MPSGKSGLARAFQKVPPQLKILVRIVWDVSLQRCTYISKTNSVLNYSDDLYQGIRKGKKTKMRDRKPAASSTY